MSYKKVYIAADKEQALRIIDQLSQAGITAFEKVEGAGQITQIVTGTGSFAGDGVYVEEKDMGAAKEIIRIYEESAGEEERPKPREFSKGTRIIAFAFAVILILSVIFSFLANFMG